jgi:hypothetical protein
MTIFVISTICFLLSYVNISVGFLNHQRSMRTDGFLKLTRPLSSSIKSKLNMEVPKYSIPDQQARFAKAKSEGRVSVRVRIRVRVRVRVKIRLSCNCY